MDKCCGFCKYGYDTKPEGQRPTAGTVWCGKRFLQMGKNREMPCFVPLKKVKHCADCRKAKITTPAGGALQLGNVWCEKKKIEIHKMRNMDCFEE